MQMIYPQLPTMAISGTNSQQRQRAVQYRAAARFSNNNTGRTNPTKGSSTDCSGDIRLARAPANVIAAKVIVSAMDI